jgi:hypothetical protein
VLSPPLSSSNPDHGLRIYETLLRIGAIRIVEPGQGPNVLSQNIVDQALALRGKNIHERELVNLYTPYLQEIIAEIDSQILLVNSEEYQWLRTSSGHRKFGRGPDLFLAYHALVEKKLAYRNAPEVERLFGRFPCWNCRSSLWCIFSAKWKIGDAAFDEKCNYLQSCGYQCRLWQGIGQLLKLILFDIEEFWMIEGLEVTITKVTKCK